MICPKSLGFQLRSPTVMENRQSTIASILFLSLLTTEIDGPKTCLMTFKQWLPKGPKGDIVMKTNLKYYLFPG